MTAAENMRHISLLTANMCLCQGRMRGITLVCALLLLAISVLMTSDNSATLDLPKMSDSDLPLQEPGADGEDFDNVSNAEVDYTHPHFRKRREFGEFEWQWNLQVSGTSSADPKNNNLSEYPKKTESDISEEVKKTPDVEDTVSDDDRRKRATYQFTNRQHVFMSSWNARNNTCMCIFLLLCDFPC